MLKTLYQHWVTYKTSIAIAQKRFGGIAGRKFLIVIAKPIASSA